MHGKTIAEVMLSRGEGWALSNKPIKDAYWSFMGEADFEEYGERLRAQGYGVIKHSKLDGVWCFRDATKPRYGEGTG